MEKSAANKGFAAMLADEYLLSFTSLSAHVQLTEFYSIFVLNFINSNSIGLQFRAGRYKIPAQQQALFASAKDYLHN